MDAQSKAEKDAVSKAELASLRAAAEAVKLEKEVAEKSAKAALQEKEKLSGDLAEWKKKARSNCLKLIVDAASVQLAASAERERTLLEKADNVCGPSLRYNCFFVFLT